MESAFSMHASKEQGFLSDVIRRRHDARHVPSDEAVAENIRRCEELLEEERQHEGRRPAPPHHIYGWDVPSRYLDANKLPTKGPNDGYPEWWGPQHIAHEKRAGELAQRVRQAFDDLDVKLRARGEHPTPFNGVTLYRRYMGADPETRAAKEFQKRRVNRK